MGMQEGLAKESMWAVQSLREADVVGLWLQPCQSLARPLPTDYFMKAKISVLSFTT